MEEDGMKEEEYGWDEEDGIEEEVGAYARGACGIIGGTCGGAWGGACAGLPYA